MSVLPNGFLDHDPHLGSLHPVEAASPKLVNDRWKEPGCRRQIKATVQPLIGRRIEPAKRASDPL